MFRIFIVIIFAFPIDVESKEKIKKGEFDVEGGYFELLEKNAISIGETYSCAINNVSYLYDSKFSSSFKINLSDSKLKGNFVSISFNNDGIGSKNKVLIITDSNINDNYKDEPLLLYNYNGGIFTIFLKFERKGLVIFKAIDSNGNISINQVEYDPNTVFNFIRVLASGIKGTYACLKQAS